MARVFFYDGMYLDFSRYGPDGAARFIVAELRWAVHWSMEGFSAVLCANQTLVQILPIIGMLGAIAAGVVTLAIRRFNRRRIFG